MAITFRGQRWTNGQTRLSTRFCLTRITRYAPSRVVASGGSTTSQEDTEENPCADRWQNMMADVTKRMWGVFDETGVFLALCRHGFALVIADMVRSGEQ